MKKFWLLVALLFLCPNVKAEDPGEVVYTQSSFGGIDNSLFTDDISPINCVECYNVYFDEKTGSLVKRKGSVKDNETAFTGNQWVRNLYVYNQSDGDSYLAVLTSASVLTTLGDTNYTSIISQISTTKFMDFATALDWLYGCNSEIIFRSSGTYSELSSVYSSTGLPSGVKYMEYINNRMWYGGMSSAPSRLWYSELNDPDNVQSLNFLNINVSDGDFITGIFSWQGKILVTKRYSTWQITETSPGTFRVDNISPDIGCLYQSTFRIYQGNYPVWLSHRGVELFDGQFNLISSPLDPVVESDWWQLNVNQNIWVQTTATDWGLGSGVNIDTTTYSGSVAFVDSVEKNNFYQYNGGGYTDDTFATGVYYRQGFYPTSEILISSATIKTLRNLAGGAVGTIAICDKNMNVLSESDSGNLWGAGVTRYINTSLNSNTTYYLRIYCSAYSGGGANKVIFSSATNVTNTVGNFEYSASSYTGFSNLANTPYLSCYITNTISTCTYNSQVFNAGTSWGSWGVFRVLNTPSSSSEISYYVRTSTASDNMASRPYISVTNNSSISSSVGPYIQGISSSTRTDNSTVHKLDETDISYYGINNIYPMAMSYNDRYYLSISTGGTKTNNDVVYFYDQNQQWGKISGNWGSMAVYRSEPYVGDSLVGQIYRHDVDDVYSDDGSAYNTFWVSKQFDYREQDPANTLRLKTYTEFWTRINPETSGTLDLNYRIDSEAEADWVLLNQLTLPTSLSTSVTKFNYPAYLEGYFIQFKFQNISTTDKFSLKGFYNIFIPQERL